MLLSYWAECKIPLSLLVKHEELKVILLLESCFGSYSHML